MSFGAPVWFWVMPLLILLVLLTAVLRSRKVRKLHAWIPPEVQTRTGTSAGAELRTLRTLLWVPGILLIGFSLARPQWGYTWREASREGLDLVIAVDTSNSMRADDFSPSRLQRAKWGLEELVDALEGDRVALVSFAGDAVIQCPLTRDYGSFLMNVEDLYPGIIPRGGTNLQRALEVSRRAFDDTAEADKVILLITDGEQHTGSLEEMTRELKEAGIRVFAVGVGTEDGSLIPLDSTGGSFLKNRQEEVVKSRLDEQTLRQLAIDTDGFYVRADPRDFGVQALIEEGLAPLTRAQLEAKQVREMEERYQIFLGLGLLLLFLEAFSKIPAVLMRRAET